ncbi:hypothetical protein ACLKA7_013908 [Drosophila subpalustris]
MRLKFKAAMQLIIFVSTLISLEPIGALPIVNDALDIIKLIHEVSNGVLTVWQLLGRRPIDHQKLPFMLEDGSSEIMNELGQISDKIQHAEEQQTEYFKLTIETLKRDFHAESLLSHKMSEVSDMTKMIKKRYRDMIEYQRSQEKLENYTLIGFAEWCVKPGSNSLTYLVEVLHETLFGEYEDNGNNSLFAQLVVNYESDEDQICATHSSPQQFAYDLYTKMTLTEIKAYTMMEFSWMTLRDSGKGNFTLEMALMHKNYQRRIEHSMKVLSDIMARIERVYWRCDPKNWQSRLGETYDEVTRLLQGYVENEVNLNSESKCFDSCEDYVDVRTERCLENEFCNKQPKCLGRLHNCRFIESDMTVCQTNNTTTSNSRRYDYIEYDNGRVLGKDCAAQQESACPTGGVRAESWSRWMFWRCNYCLCLCDEDGPQSDRYFNLRDTISDYKDDMIVTGARFVKHQRVFHLQLQQGKLLPGGLINQSTLAWIPLQSYDVSHVDIRNGYDYHKLTYDSRSLDLDEISVENDTLVVTGARFRVVEKHLNLEVRFSSFNFTTGRLLRPEVNSFWLGNDKTTEHNDKPRQKLMLYDPQVSTKSSLSSLPLSKDNQYMEFVSSSVDKDAAQSTVPFIDIQDVVPNPAVPLSGLGIYHKGRKGFGGFFAPKIVTYYNFWKKLVKSHNYP